MYNSRINWCIVMDELKEKSQWAGDGPLANVTLALVRYWPLPRGKSGLLRVLTRWCYQGFFPLRHVHGAKLRVDVTDYIGQLLAQVGVFESKSLALACSLMKDGGWFVDAGCNLGLYTCVVGALPGVRTLAIDPSPRALAQLERNVALNPSVTCTRVYTALAEVADFVQFEIPGQQNLGTARVQTVKKGDNDGRILVWGLPAVQILQTLDVTPIHLLKIDVEGGEFRALKGWDWTVRGRPNHILCEHLQTSESAGASMQVEELLRSKGYQPHTVDGKPWDRSMALPEDNLWWRGQ